MTQIALGADDVERTRDGIGMIIAQRGSDMTAALWRGSDTEAAVGVPATRTRKALGEWHENKTPRQGRIRHDTKAWR